MVAPVPGTAAEMLRVTWAAAILAACHGNDYAACVKFLPCVANPVIEVITPAAADDDCSHDSEIYLGFQDPGCQECVMSHSCTPDAGCEVGSKWCYARYANCPCGLP
jgi:hypothetical protein